MTTPSHLVARATLIRARWFGRFAVFGFALSHVVHAAPSEVNEEVALARKSHERNGSDNLRDGEDIPELAPSIADELPQVERAAFALNDADSLLTAKERRDLHRATVRARVARGSAMQTGV